MAETDPRYWKCKCRKNFTHKTEEADCPICGAEAEHQPASRTDELIICTECGEAILDGQEKDRYIGGKPYCPDCYVAPEVKYEDPPTFECTMCHDHYSKDLDTMEGGLCEDCRKKKLDGNYVVYSVENASVQDVAEQEIGRKLTAKELPLVQEKINSWSFTRIYETILGDIEDVLAYLEMEEKKKKLIENLSKPVCPKCHKSIDFLAHHESGAGIRHDYRLDKDGDGEDQDTITKDCDEHTFDCPECLATLFFNYEEAENFLKMWDAEE